MLSPKRSTTVTCKKRRTRDRHEKANKQMGAFFAFNRRLISTTVSNRRGGGSSYLTLAVIVECQPARGHGIGVTVAGKGVQRQTVLDSGLVVHEYLTDECVCTCLSFRLHDRQLLSS